MPARRLAGAPEVKAAPPAWKVAPQGNVTSGECRGFGHAIDHGLQALCRQEFHDGGLLAGARPPPCAALHAKTAGDNIEIYVASLPTQVWAYDYDTKSWVLQR